MKKELGHEELERLTAIGRGTGRPRGTPPGRHPWSWIGTAAGLAVGIAVGALVARLGAPRSPADDSAEAGFARDMSAHHL